MSKEGEKFWQEEKARQEGTVWGGNQFWKQTIKDSQSIKSDPHPKKLYIECLSNNSYMRHYAAQKDLLVEDMTAIICKDLGCLVNYCGLLKQSLESDWKNSSDCVNEYDDFTECMKQEHRRFSWLPEKDNVNKYDYIQQRLLERKQNNKFRLLEGLDSSVSD